MLLYMYWSCEHVYKQWQATTSIEIILKIIVNPYCQVYIMEHVIHFL